MGGRLDATNAVTPLVSVLAPIGMDHQTWLGDTLAQIAGEKAGIVKAGVPAISAPQSSEAQLVLEAKAGKVAAPIIFITAPWSGQAPGLAGSHQRWNAAVACAALRAAGIEVDASVEAEGLRRVTWPGRFQRVADNLVIDGAHNPEAIETLVATWREFFGEVKSSLVFAALRDKDAAHLLRALRSIADEVWLVPVNNPRGLAPAELRPSAEAAGFTGIHEASVSQAVTDARSSGHPVLVAGSLFLAGEVLALLQGAAKPSTSTQ
jgi:dihydrofolate synthase/folylpolyglutamate synthase